MTKFMRRLELAMQLAGLTAKELSEKSGISEASISQYRSGRSLPRGTDRLYFLAKALDVSPGWLLGYDGPIQQTDNDAITLFESLNSENRLRAIDYMRYLKSKENDNVSR